MTRVHVVVGAMLLAGCASGPVGVVRHYERSNRNGSERETVVTYRSSQTQVEVFKAREKCTSAAWVVGTLDAAQGFAPRLSGGRAVPGGRQEQAVLTFDAATRTASASTVGGEAIGSVVVDDVPWHLYDFDLASLSELPAPQVFRREAFHFGLPLVWMGDGPTLRSLGRVEASYVGETVRRGVKALEYRLTLPGGEGTLWLDARDGSIVEAQSSVPNHAEYTDFQLKLMRVEHGADAWNAVLRQHFSGCPEH